MKNPKIRKMIGSFAIELLIYAVLVVAYFFAVLRLLGDPLSHLYSSNLVFSFQDEVGFESGQGKGSRSISDGGFLL